MWPLLLSWPGPSLVVVMPLSSPVVPRHATPASTLRAVARSGGWGPSRRPPPLVLLASSSPRPPVVPLVWWRWWHPRPPHPSSSSFRPRSTPRAVAREAGGGWWVVGCRVLLGWRCRRWHPLIVVAVVRLLVSSSPSLSSLLPLVVVVSLPFPSSPFPPPIPLSHPPCEQGLAAVVVVETPPSPHRPVVPVPAAPPLPSSWPLSVAVVGI
jgi:hypothetical protein